MGSQFISTRFPVFPGVFTLGAVIVLMTISFSWCPQYAFGL
jgi:hypothetical protein